jgi:DNA-binding transcriptional LysR family regulator
MDERELRAFISIAEAGRLDWAAKALGYSQPALSYQLRRLESTLGASLFTRNSKGAKLTVTGQVIVIDGGQRFSPPVRDVQFL